MIQPYYKDDYATIYHGDCCEILPQIEKVDLVLTDPPYGMAYNHGKTTNRKWDSRHHGVAITGDDAPFDPVVFLGFPQVVLWGANYYADKLPPSRGWLVWQKRPNMKPNDFSDCELAWTNQPMPVRCFSHMWNGVLRDSEVAQKTLHPTQKPIALMRWCLSFFPEAKTILDPFMGSGATLRAAKDLGLQSIGIEIEEKYCEIAAERLRQEVFDFE